ncbi:phosphoribosylaminoimidazolecarboxamide formyltransferase, partial [Ruminococcaceae bacterium OttesenSCG-928-N02]|nr:phosphoribosylaminoimidazolecarboxamide formyltransferase [Ruminococcaceae bacterium OttesenSCG-928-N02]
ILKEKKGGKYNVVQVDPTYTPPQEEVKQVFGVTFTQSRNDAKIDESLLNEIVTREKELPADAKRDMLIALITLKYTQSNSVCYVQGGQAIGVGAGQQSRVHCTRLAGNKADVFHLRQHPKVLALQFVEKIKRADRDNAIDQYISEEEAPALLAEGAWQQAFAVRPEPLTAGERAEWLATFQGVTLGSDAFFPFGDNIERAARSGVKYVVQAGGSVRDDNVIETCDKYGMVMAFTHLRLFHH